MSVLRARSTVNRAVHLQVAPRPTNIGETREIHRLLTQFGEIEYFKSMKYASPPTLNSILVIFKEERAAEICLRRSPIRFRMGRVADEPQTDSSNDQRFESAPPTPPQTHHASHFGKSTSHFPPLPPPFMQAPTVPVAPRLFQLMANKSTRGYEEDVRRGAYHGPFKYKPTFGQEDLEKRVPLRGLAVTDWRPNEKPQRIQDREQILEKMGTTRRKSLQELYEEGERGASEDRMRAPEDNVHSAKDNMQPVGDAFTRKGM